MYNLPVSLKSCIFIRLKTERCPGGNICSEKYALVIVVVVAVAAGPLLTFYSVHFTVYSVAASAAAVATSVCTYNKHSNITHRWA